MEISRDGATLILDEVGAPQLWVAPARVDALCSFTLGTSILRKEKSLASLYRQRR